MSLPPRSGPGPHGSGLAGCPSPAECREAGKALEGCPGPAPSQHQRGGAGKEEERDLGNRRCGRSRRVSEEGPGDRRQAVPPPLLLFAPLPPFYVQKKKKIPYQPEVSRLLGALGPVVPLVAGQKLPPRPQGGQASCTATHCSDTSLYPGIREAELRQGHWRDFKTSLNYN